MKNIKLLALAGVLLLGAGCGTDSKSCKDQEVVAQSTECLSLNDVYNSAIRFLDSGEIAGLEAKLSALSAVSAGLDEKASKDFGKFVSAVEDIIASEGKELSQGQKDTLRAHLKDAYTPINKKLCK